MDGGQEIGLPVARGYELFAEQAGVAQIRLP